jgi:hypothetical protein
MPYLTNWKTNAAHTSTSTPIKDRFNSNPLISTGCGTYYFSSTPGMAATN